MNKKEKSYSIHDIVTFKIINNDKFLNRLFCSMDSEYRNFQSESVSDFDFTIHLGNFSPSNQECYILDNSYYIKEDYFFCRDSYKIAKWELEMSGFESGNMEVRISTNSAASMIISGFLIDPLINFKLNEHGYTLAHSSCVSKNGYAHMFTAQGGGGKTSTALHCVDRGLNFLGDNFVIVDKCRMLSFLSPLNMFSFNLVPIVKKNMDARTKVEFYLKNLLYKMTRLRIVTKINVKEIFPDSLGDNSKIESVFLLIPKEKFELVKIDKEELVGHMVANMKLDFFPFIKYMMEYSYMYPTSKMATHWQSYEENLKRNLNGDITIYKVEVPQKYDVSVFEKIFRAIENGSNS